MDSKRVPVLNLKGSGFAMIVKSEKTDIWIKSEEGKLVIIPRDPKVNFIYVETVTDGIKNQVGMVNEVSITQ